MTDADEIVEAAKAGDVQRIATLLARDGRLIAARLPSGETPLMAALYRGHHGVVDALLDAGAPLDAFAAAALGRMDDLDRALAASAAAVNARAYDGWTPLHLAAFFGHHDAVVRLLRAGADIAAQSRNSMRNTPLHAALAGNHTKIAVLLIERGAPVDARDGGAHTPLHIAAENGSVEAVKALLDRRADPHAVDGEEKTPLSRAAARNHTEVIDLITTRE
jgi:ankyrin repeat protein